MTDLDAVQGRLDELSSLMRELEPILQTVVLNDTTILDALAQMLGVVQHMNSRAQAREAQVAELLVKVERVLADRHPTT